MNFRNQLGCDTFQTEEKGLHQICNIQCQNIFEYKERLQLNVLIPTVLILNVALLLCRSRGVHNSLLSEGALHGATAQAQVRSWASHLTRRQDLNVWSVLLFFILDRDRKHPRVRTHSRSFWKKSRWGKCPVSNSCWIRPACRGTSNLKRWGHVLSLKEGPLGLTTFFCLLK